MVAFSSPHASVMLNEVLSILSPAAGEIYVDGTFGAGGYTRAFLEATSCTVIAIDRDPSAIKIANAVREEFGDRFVFLSGCYGEAVSLIRAAGFQFVDGFILDIGVSSMQIDQAERGFSFRFDGPLDMRMDNRSGPTAADLVNTLKEEDLANILFRYGEERKSRRITRRIAEVRQEIPFKTTSQLADLVRTVVPRSPKDKIDPATRTFQALRIAVNDELGELERGLDAAEELLCDGGRLVVVSFHSLEDSIVKDFLRQRSGMASSPSRHIPASVRSASDVRFTLSPRKPLMASDEETVHNPRARSARLRGGVRRRAGQQDFSPALQENGRRL